MERTHFARPFSPSDLLSPNPETGVGVPAVDRGQFQE
jgi:hypothetical protein